MEMTEKNKVSQHEHSLNYSSNVGTPGGSPRKKCRSGDCNASNRPTCDNMILSEDQTATLPLLHLVRQLLRNASTQTLMRLQVNFRYI